MNIQKKNSTFRPNCRASSNTISFRTQLARGAVGRCIKNFYIRLQIEFLHLLESNISFNKVMKMFFIVAFHRFYLGPLLFFINIRNKVPKLEYSFSYIHVLQLFNFNVLNCNYSDFFTDLFYFINTSNKY